MKRPNFNVASEVKVINKQSVFYGKCGHVHNIIVAVDDLMYDATVDKAEIKDLYARGLESRMQWYVHVKIDECVYSFTATEVEAV